MTQILRAMPSGFRSAFLRRAGALLLVVHALGGTALAVCTGPGRKSAPATLGGAWDALRSSGNGVLMSGANAWRVTEGGVTLFDLSNPAAPLPKGFAPVEGMPVGRPALANGILAVRLSDGGVALLDTRVSPATLAGLLRVRSACPDAGGCTERVGEDAAAVDLASEGAALFVAVEGRRGSGASAVRWFAVQKWDLAVPASPRLVAESRTMEGPADGKEVRHGSAIVVASGKIYWPFVEYASASDSTGTWKVRVLETATMAKLAEDSPIGPGLSGRSGPPSVAGGLVFGNNRLYVAHPGTLGKIRILDVSGPSTIAQCGEISVPDLDGPLARTLQRLLAPTSPAGASGTKLYSWPLGTTCSPGTPATIEPEGTFSSGGIAVRETNQTAVLTDRGGGILVLDVATTPKIKGSLAGAGGTISRGVTSADRSRTYLATAPTVGEAPSAFVLLDTDDLNQPFAVGKVTTTHPVAALSAGGGLLAAAGGGKLSLYSLAEPGSPELKVTFDVAGVSAVAVSSNRLAAGTGGGSVALWDVTNPALPLNGAVVSAGGPVRFLVIDGSRLFAAAGDAGVVGWDIASPLTPSEKGRLALLGASASAIPAHRAVHRNGFVYTLAGDGSLLVSIDARNDGGWRQTALSVLAARSTGLGVEPDGPRISVAGDAGVERWSLTPSPAVPVRLELIPTFAPARDVEVGSARIFTATSSLFETIDLGSASCTDAAFTVESAGLEAGFTDTTTGPVGLRVWTFGDGQVSTDAAPSHAFPSAGSWPVFLDVFGPDGASVSSASKVVTVGTTEGPAVRIVSPLAGETISNGATVSVDVTGFLLECDATVPPAPGRGRWVLSVDEIEDGTACLEEAALAGVYPAGARRIVAELVGMDGAPLVPPARATVDVIISESSVIYRPALVVPGVARIQGAAGASFRTTLWLTNMLGDSLVRLRFVPADAASTGGANVTRDLFLPQGQTVSFVDVLSEAFGATSDTYGVVHVSVAEGLPVPLVTSRTFNDAGSSGTYGQFIPGVAVDRLAAGSLRLDGLGGAPRFRTNVGVVNPSTTQSLVATVTVLGADGNRAGNVMGVAVPPGSVVQLNRVDERAGAGALPLFSAVVTSSSPFFAYASKLDAVTSDPVFVPGDLVARSTGWIDGVASRPGDGGVFFRTDLHLSNRSTLPARLSVAFRPRGATAPTASTTLDFAPGESKGWSDALQELFALGDSAGTLELTAFDTALPLLAWARTYTDLGEAGSYGQFIPAFGVPDLSGAFGVVLPGLSENPAFRTNVGLVNSGNDPVSVRATLYSPAGVRLGEATWTVDARQSLFLFRPLRSLAPDGTATDAYLDLLPSSAGSIYAWASMVDNRSSDQTFIRPLPRPGTPVPPAR